MSDEQINSAINVSAEGAKSKVIAAKSLARFFEIDVTIKIFGVTIFSWHFPPEEKSKVDNIEDR